MTAAELIGLFEPKVLALPARALRSTPRLRSVTAQRLRVAQTSCFPLTACCACRPRAGPTIPQPASSSTARTSTFCRRPRWTSSARVQQAAGGLAASCAASLGAVGSGARVACAPIRPGRSLGQRARAHGRSLCACVLCTTLYYTTCATVSSRAEIGVCAWSVCRLKLILRPPQATARFVHSLPRPLSLVRLLGVLLSAIKTLYYIKVYCTSIKYNLASCPIILTERSRWSAQAGESS